jgi:hypothetical protein
MPVICPVCDGSGYVVWEDDGIPRRPKSDREPAHECPACDGYGYEPDGTVCTNGERA